MAALGSCTSMAVRAYAGRHRWQLHQVDVRPCDVGQSGDGSAFSRSSTQRGGKCCCGRQRSVGRQARAHKGSGGENRRTARPAAKHAVPPIGRRLRRSREVLSRPVTPHMAIAWPDSSPT
ncbi:hypothetical protein [Streptomyces sp. NPDC051219]|uniref:OsmC family protein n=1 Tax=Streptomyces sp. NPDC051219 TaxID=3155283 RepID=UPI003417DCF3